MKILISVLAAMTALMGAASAAIVNVDFYIMVTEVNEGAGNTFGAEEGDKSTGTLSYDDGDLTDGSGEADIVTITFPPLPFTEADQNEPPTAIFVDGVLTALNFFVDDPTGEFIFEAGSTQGVFMWEYIDFENVLDDDQNIIDQIAIASVSGVISATPFSMEPMPEVPLPAAAILFISGFAGLAGWRRRRRTA